MAKSVSIMADSDDCSITLTGEAAVKVWNFIIEEVYIQKPMDVCVESKRVAEVAANECKTMLNEGYLGKV